MGLSSILCLCRMRIKMSVKHDQRLLMVTMTKLFDGKIEACEIIDMNEMYLYISGKGVCF